MYTVRIFMKCTHVCATQITYLIEPDFPCVADEIAEPRPDMNVKVAASTVSEEYINTISHTSCRFYVVDTNGLITKLSI